MRKNSKRPTPYHNFTGRKNGRIVSACVDPVVVVQELERRGFLSKMLQIAEQHDEAILVFAFEPQGLHMFRQGAKGSGMQYGWFYAHGLCAQMRDLPELVDMVLPLEKKPCCGLLLPEPPRGDYFIMWTSACLPPEITGGASC